MSNESGLSTNATKDVSISNVPAVGKRDKLMHTTTTPEGTTTATYTNEYQWEASDVFQERVEQWLYIRGSYVTEVFATYAVSRLWIKLATALIPLSPSLGYTGLVVFGVGVACLCWVVSRKPANLAASALRLLSIALGAL